MSNMYEFECIFSDISNIRINKGDVSWGSNIEWLGICKDEEMPLNTWCVVKSYQFNMMGKWRRIR